MCRKGFGMSEDEELPILDTSDRPSLRHGPDGDFPFFGDDDGTRITEEELVLQVIEGTEACVKVPGSISRYLRSYQREGVRFMYDAYSQNRGCILADEMGLGKTVQIVALLSAILNKKGNATDREFRPLPSPGVLILVPNNLIEHWLREIQTWAHISVALYAGTQKNYSLLRARKGHAEVLLASYGTVRAQAATFAALDWDLIVLDEVHALKGTRTATARAVRTIVERCPRRIGISGTVMANRFEELHAILDLVAPGSLGSWDAFKHSYVVPIKQGQAYNATPAQVSACRARSRELQALLADYFLQRDKRELAGELPQKTDRIVFCAPTDSQMTVYRRALDTPVMHLLRTKDERCDKCDSGRVKIKCCYETTADGREWRALVLPALTQLTKICNHPFLLFPNTNDCADKQERDWEFARAALHGMKIPRNHTQPALAEMSPQQVVAFSGKTETLVKLLDMCARRNDKVLLFSNSVRMLDILESVVQLQPLPTSRLDGRTNPKQRQTIIDQFIASEKGHVLLLSTKVGGLGLNLSAANVCILFEPNWNPAHDLQAQDRLYRIGQKRNVSVFRLICAGTIEELMFTRQVYKQQLANVGTRGTNERRYFTAVQGVKGREGELFGLHNLLQVESDRLRTSDIINRKQMLGLAMADNPLLPTPPQASSTDAHAAGDGEGATAAAATTRGAAHRLSQDASEDPDDVYEMGEMAAELTLQVEPTEAESARKAVRAAGAADVSAATERNPDAAEEVEHQQEAPASIDENSQSLLQYLRTVGAVRFTTSAAAMLGENAVERNLSDRASRATLQFELTDAMRGLTPKQRAFVNIAEHFGESTLEFCRRVVLLSESEREALLQRYQKETGLA